MGNRDLYAASAATAAVLAATTRAGLAGEPAAIVTEVEAGSPAVGELDLLARDLVVTLANGERIVLGYLASCVRETLAGPGDPSRIGGWSRPAAGPSTTRQLASSRPAGTRT